MARLTWSRIVRRVVCVLVGAVILVPAAGYAQTQNLNLAWNANPETDIASYYVHVGTSSGNYNIAVAAVPANQLTYAFPATPGVRYYFAVKAVNTAGMWSAPSAEVIGGVPTLGQPANQSSLLGAAVAPLTLTAADPDGGTLRFSASGLPAGLTINATSGQITGVPLALGTSTVVVSVFDGTVTVQRSFSWSIVAGTVAPTVSAVSASPNTGSGTTQTFALQYSDSVGALDLKSAAVRFSGTYSAVAGSCALSYDRAAGVVSLLDDAGTSWLSASFGSGTLQNSQCALALGSSSASASGNTLTLNLAMTFKAPYAGTKNVFMYAESTGGANSGWQDRGNWSVPEAVVSSPSSGPVARWSFDEGAGTATADAVGPNDGSLANGATWTAGYSGTGVVLDGANDYVGLPNFDVAGSALTITSWVKVASVAGASWPRFISKATGTADQEHYWMLGLVNDGTNRLRFRLKAGGTTTTLVASSGSLPLNVWQHVAATYDGSAMRLYLNGAKVGEVAKSGSLGTNLSVPVSIGRNPDGSNYLHGSIDDVRIYNRALSATELAAVRPSVTVSSSKSSPQAKGTAVTFSAAASGGSGSYQYKWWLFNGTSWAMLQDWSSNASVTWTPGQAGNYRIGGWVRSAGLTTDAAEANDGIDFVISEPAAAASPLTIGSLTSNVASPRAAGTAITFTVAATGGTAPYQYKWWLFNGTSWTILGNWSTNPSITWTPSQAGTYRIGAWVRNAGATADAAQANTGVDYVITAPAPSGAALQLVSVTSSRTSPSAVGAAVTFTATASGGTAPYQYKWWLFNGTIWTILSDWSSTASVTWTPAAAGTYRIGAWVRNAGATADAPQANTGVNFVITAGSPIQVQGLTSSVSSPSIGAAVTLTASVTGGTAPYQYKWWLFNGTTWTVLSDWGSASSVTWTPSQRGSYRIGVWARNAGATADAPESNAGLNLTVN